MRHIVNDKLCGAVGVFAFAIYLEEPGKILGRTLAVKLHMVNGTVVQWEGERRARTKKLGFLLHPTSYGSAIPTAPLKTSLASQYGNRCRLRTDLETSPYRNTSRFCSSSSGVGDAEELVSGCGGTASTHSKSPSAVIGSPGNPEVPDLTLSMLIQEVYILRASVDGEKRG